MRFQFIRLAVHDIDPPAVCSPSLDPGGEILVGIGDASVMLFFKGVIRRTGIGIPPGPELLDKAFAFLLVFQVLEYASFFIRNDVDNILIKPFLVMVG